MSHILEQIKALQRIQSKIDTFLKAKELLGQLEEVPDFPGVSGEVKDEVAGFIERTIEALNSGAPAPRPVTKPEIPQESAEEPVAKPKPAQPAKKDAVSFMIKNKALENKRVRLQTPNGPVLGRVTALSFPNVVVETDTDFRIEVDPDKLELI